MSRKRPQILAFRPAEQAVIIHDGPVVIGIEDTHRRAIRHARENAGSRGVYFESELIGLNLPEKVEYKVTYTTDAVKGNTSTNALKDATLENGLEVKVPLFICEGDVVVISTKDGKYVSRK